MHLDGARIWHVAIETGKTLDVLCKPFDSISVCFSKGLGQYDFAPVRTRTLARPDALKLPIYRCPRWFLLNWEQGVYRARAQIQEGLWWRNATNGLPRCVRSLCPHS
jgi:hypothetical protein